MIKPIVWSEERESCDEVRYNHCIGTTALGDFVITWKGWKSHPCYNVEWYPASLFWQGYESDLKSAKRAAEEHYFKTVSSCLTEDKKPPMNL